jgi:peptidoglycan/xylan/chitin deacetylase (PgdA/CDA1 family)
MDKTLVTGSYDPPSEYRREYIPTAVANEVISNVEPGSIVYLHDGVDSYKEEFIRSVELILSALRVKGYSFVRLDHKQ